MDHICAYISNKVWGLGEGEKERARGFLFLKKKCYLKIEVFVEKIMIYNCFKFKFYIEMGGHTSSARGL